MKTNVVTSYHTAVVLLLLMLLISNAPAAVAKDAAVAPGDAMLELLELKSKTGTKFARLMHCLDLTIQ